MGEKVSALEKALKILSSFGMNRREIGTCELSQLTGVHISTVSRIANKLEENGFLARDLENHRYRIGPVFIQMGLSMMEYLNDHLIDLAKPHVDDLRDQLGEALTFTFLYGDDVIIGYIADKPGLFRVNVEIGEITPFNAAASAKVIYAHLSRQKIDKKIRKGLPRFTDNTIVDENKLREHLVQIRKQGYAVDNEEIHVGFNAISTPIFNARNEAVAALSVVGLPSSFDFKSDNSILEKLRKTSQEISRKLG